MQMSNSMTNSTGKLSSNVKVVLSDLIIAIICTEHVKYAY